MMKNEEKNMTISDLIMEGADQLKSIPSKRLEATVLLSYVLKKNKVELYRNMLNHIDSTLAVEYRKLLQRRISGEPLCYITGKRDFFGLEFSVNQFTLIPRHETELLVEEAIRFLKESKMDQSDVLEIGIGSGAVSVALSYHCPSINMDAVDISNKALCIASINIGRYSLQNRIRLLEGDLFNPLEQDKKYDLIISNPPYIPTGDISSLSKEVQAEPRLALDGGTDGLSFLRRIIHDSIDYLKPGGCLMLEINGEMHEKKITELFYEQGYRKVFQKKDLAGIPRVVGGSKL
jgi:release factor glutamine methyltransferase